MAGSIDSIERVRSRLSERIVARVGKYLLLFVGLLGTLFPLYWMVITSLKGADEVTAVPPTVLPHEPTLQPYLSSFAAGSDPWIRWFVNTIIISGGVTLLVLAATVPAAYVIARWNLPGMKVVFAVFIATMMVPGQVLLLPLFDLFATFGLIDTYLGAIFAYTGLFMGFSLFLLRNFFRTLPSDVEDAARIAGIDRWKFLLKIVLPLALPGIATTGVFIFVFTWREFLFALTFLNTESMYTMSVGIASLSSAAFGLRNITQVMAMGTLTVLPVVVLFAVVQDRFIQGITTGFEE